MNTQISYKDLKQILKVIELVTLGSVVSKEFRNMNGARRDIVGPTLSSFHAQNLSKFPYVNARLCYQYPGVKSCHVLMVIYSAWTGTGSNLHLCGDCSI